MAITAFKKESWRRKLMLEMDTLNQWHITMVQHIPFKWSTSIAKMFKGHM